MKEILITSSVLIVVLLILRVLFVLFREISACLTNILRKIIRFFFPPCRSRSNPPWTIKSPKIRSPQ